MKLLGYLNLTGVLTCETGLLIGGNDSFGIGGIDKAMIRQSFQGNRPYLPGSSLKGKMRNLLEQALKKRIKDGEVHSCNQPACEVCRIFGAGKTEDVQSLTRLIVRDAKLIAAKDDAPAQAQSALADYLERVAEYQRQHGSYVEIKTENYINRKTGAAVAPRRFERVPAGMKFAVDLVYRVFETDGGQTENLDLKLFSNVVHAFDLLRWEYVGASGSRGYGRVNFSDLRLSFTDALSRTEKWGGDFATEELIDWLPPDELVSVVNAQTTPPTSPVSGETDESETQVGEAAAEPEPVIQGEESNEG